MSGGLQLQVQLYREQSQFQRNQAMVQKTNLYVSGLPITITEQEVREMFQEFGSIRSILLKTPLAVNEQTKHITSMLPIYCMAYVNFENEEDALAAFALNSRNPFSPLKVTYYEKQPTQPIQMIADDSRGGMSTNYRILFITKMDRNVSLTNQHLSQSQCQIRSKEWPFCPRTDG